MDDLYVDQVAGKIVSGDLCVIPETPDPIFPEKILAVIILLKNQYHYFARLLSPHWGDSSLKSPAISEYMIYRIVSTGSSEGLQRFRRYIGEQNKWNHADTKRACFSGFQKGIQNLIKSRAEATTYLFDGINDICGIWERATHATWENLARYASKRANIRLLEYTERKCKSTTRKSLAKTLSNEEMKEHCLEAAKAPNSKFFIEVYLGFGGNWHSEWFLQQDKDFISLVYVTAASRGRLRTCKDLACAVKNSDVSIDSATHLRAFFSAAYNGQRNVTTMYLSDDSPIRDDDFNDIFNMLKWVTLLHHRSAVSYDLEKLGESEPDMDSLVRLLKEYPSVCSDFMYADFSIETLQDHSEWKKDGGLDLLLEMCRLGFFKTVVEILVEKKEYVKLIAEKTRDMPILPNITFLFDYLLDHADFDIPTEAVTQVMLDAIVHKNPRVFFKCLPFVTKEISEELLKHPQMMLGSIYREALDAFTTRNHAEAGQAEAD